MTELLNRRPDRPLAPERHEELRAELLDAIEADRRRPKHRLLVPVAAAAVVAVVAGVIGAVPLLTKRDDTGTPVSGQLSGQSRIRDLSPDRTAALRSQCLAEANRITANGITKPFQDFAVVRAFELPGVRDPKVVSTWLIGKGATYFWLCSRTAGGVISESSVRVLRSQRLGGDPIRSVARNAGIYAGPVDRVTVQVPGQAAEDAVLVDGFWFAATVGRTGWGPYDADDPLRNSYVVRGYAKGRQVYLSSDPKSDCNVVPSLPAGMRQPVARNSRPCKTVYSWPS